MRSRLGPGRAQRYPLFDVIRLLAALLVIFSHVVHHDRAPRAPARSTSGKLGVTWGHVGVAIFFVTSGYLVTESWHRRPEGGGYLLKRVLRIWPGVPGRDRCSASSWSVPIVTDAQPAVVLHRRPHTGATCSTTA